MMIGASRKTHPRALVLTFLALALVLTIRNIVSRLPHEPRLFLRNDSSVVLEANHGHSACGDLLPRTVRDGESIPLDLIPRVDCQYEVDHHTVEGERLLELVDFARSQKADVEITVGFDFVDLDVTTRHRFLWW